MVDDYDIVSFSKVKGSGSDSALAENSSGASDVAMPRESHSEHMSISVNADKPDKDKEGFKQRCDKERKRDQRERTTEDGERKDCLRNAVGDVRTITIEKVFELTSCELGDQDTVKTPCRLQNQIVENADSVGGPMHCNLEELSGMESDTFDNIAADGGTVNELAKQSNRLGKRKYIWRQKSEDSKKSDPNSPSMESKRKIDSNPISPSDISQQDELSGGSEDVNRSEWDLSPAHSSTQSQSCSIRKLLHLNIVPASHVKDTSFNHPSSQQSQERVPPPIESPSLEEDSSGHIAVAQSNSLQNSLEVHVTSNDVSGEEDFSEASTAEISPSEDIPETAKGNRGEWNHKKILSGLTPIKEDLPGDTETEPEKRDGESLSYRSNVEDGIQSNAEAICLDIESCKRELKALDTDGNEIHEGLETVGHDHENDIDFKREVETASAISERNYIGDCQVEDVENDRKSNKDRLGCEKKTTDELSLGMHLEEQETNVSIKILNLEDETRKSKKEEDVVRLESKIQLDEACLQPLELLVSGVNKYCTEETKEQHCESGVENEKNIKTETESLDAEKLLMSKKDHKDHETTREHEEAPNLQAFERKTMHCDDGGNEISRLHQNDEENDEEEEIIQEDKNGSECDEENRVEKNEEDMIFPLGEGLKERENVSGKEQHHEQDFVERQVNDKDDIQTFEETGESFDSCSNEFDLARDVDIKYIPNVDTYIECFGEPSQSREEPIDHLNETFELRKSVEQMSLHMRDAADYGHKDHAYCIEKQNEIEKSTSESHFNVIEKKSKQSDNDANKLNKKKTDTEISGALDSLADCKDLTRQFFKETDIVLEDLVDFEKENNAIVKGIDGEEMGGDDDNTIPSTTRDCLVGNDIRAEQETPCIATIAHMYEEMLKEQIGSIALRCLQSEMDEDSFQSTSICRDDERINDTSECAEQISGAVDDDYFCDARSKIYQLDDATVENASLTDNQVENSEVNTSKRIGERVKQINVLEDIHMQEKDDNIVSEPNDNKKVNTLRNGQLEECTDDRKQYGEEHINELPEDESEYHQINFHLKAKQLKKDTCLKEKSDQNEEDIEGQVKENNDIEIELESAMKNEQTIEQSPLNVDEGHKALERELKNINEEERENKYLRESDHDAVGIELDFKYSPADAEQEVESEEEYALKDVNEEEKDDELLKPDNDVKLEMGIEELSKCTDKTKERYEMCTYQNIEYDDDVPENELNANESLAETIEQEGLVLEDIKEKTDKRVALELDAAAVEHEANIEQLTSYAKKVEEKEEFILENITDQTEENVLLESDESTIEGEPEMKESPNGADEGETWEDEEDLTLEQINVQVKDNDDNENEPNQRTELDSDEKYQCQIAEQTQKTPEPCETDRTTYTSSLKVQLTGVSNRESLHPDRLAQILNDDDEDNAEDNIEGDINQVSVSNLKTVSVERLRNKFETAANAAAMEEIKSDRKRDYIVKEAERECQDEERQDSGIADGATVEESPDVQYDGIIRDNAAMLEPLDQCQNEEMPPFDVDELTLKDKEEQPSDGCPVGTKRKGENVVIISQSGCGECFHDSDLLGEAMNEVKNMSIDVEEHIADTKEISFTAAARDTKLTEMDVDEKATKCVKMEGVRQIGEETIFSPQEVIGYGDEEAVLHEPKIIQMKPDFTDGNDELEESEMTDEASIPHHEAQQCENEDKDTQEDNQMPWESGSPVTWNDKIGAYGTVYTNKVLTVISKPRSRRIKYSQSSEDKITIPKQPCYATTERKEGKPCRELDDVVIQVEEANTATDVSVSEDKEKANAGMLGIPQPMHSPAGELCLNRIVLHHLKSPLHNAGTNSYNGMRFNYSMTLLIV